MATNASNYHRTNAGLGALPLAVLSALAFVFVACGIGFSEEPDETELLKKIAVEEPVVSGALVIMFLEYAQQYPVEVQIKCDLLSVKDIPTVTPLPTQTVSPLALRRTPKPTLPNIPRERATPTNKVFDIVGRTLEPNEAGGPAGEATPELGKIEGRFIAPEPGDYVIRCYTPLDQNNAIFQDLTVLPE